MIIRDRRPGLAILVSGRCGALGWRWMGFEMKAQVVVQSLRPDETVKAVAAWHGTQRNLLTAQLAMPAAIALSARLQPVLRALRDNHVFDELHRYQEPRDCRPVWMVFVHKCDKTLPKRYRMCLANLPLVSAMEKEGQRPDLRANPTDTGRNIVQRCQKYD